VLLRYDTEAGHSSGGMPVSKRIDQMADELSFLFWPLGVTLNFSTTEKSNCGFCGLVRCSGAL
jgi:hypothetical protein